MARPPTDVIKLLAAIGIIVLPFEVGLETDVGQLAGTGARSLVVATAGFILPCLLGFGLSRWGLGLDLLPSPFVGGTLSATSIGAAIENPAVIAKILAHLGLSARAPPRTPAQAFALFRTA